MREQITRNWNWNNGSHFANWIYRDIAPKVLTEFWYWYQDLKKTILPLSDRDNEETILAEMGELSLDGFPLPTIDIKFCICDKEFEVRDALLLTVLPMCVITMSMTDEPDEWQSIDGVREYALGFFNGVVRGMLN